MEYQDKRVDPLRKACKSQPKDLIEKWCEGAARSQNVGGTTVLCRVLHDFLMYVDGNDISISPHLIMRGIWEPWVTMAIARHVRPGWRCVDVGANMGYFTLLMALLATERGHVLAVEPRPEAMELLRSMVSVNGLGERVETLLAGASDSTHDALLEVPGALHGGTYLREVPGSIGGARLVRSEEEILKDRSMPSSCTVGCVPLDEWCQTMQWDFIKIDVEGMEHRVLNGLRKTLDAQEHVIVAVEVTPFHWQPGELEEFVRDFESRGFSIGMVDRDQGNIVDVDVTSLPTEEGQWEMVWLKK